MASRVSAASGTAQITIERKQAALQRAWSALEQRRFFKLICGGSFTETRKIARFTTIYGQAGVDCIDIAPDLEVLNAVAAGLAKLPLETPKPLVMVSLPLDPDPHFRKIELIEPDCIRCGACLPVCPTDAITLPEALDISQSLCYGCGRCVPLCPTDALHLLPFQVEAKIAAVLSHPLVGAVEIHSRHVDPLMLDSFWQQWQPLLSDKLVALCFNPTGIPAAQWLQFIETARQWTHQGSARRLILQIDGAPMSGSDHPETSKPAINAATLMYPELQVHFPDLPVTISGGINRHTAEHLDHARFISGVGMGTVARQAIWEHLHGKSSHELAVALAWQLVNPFKSRPESTIIKMPEEGANSDQTIATTQPSIT